MSENATTRGELFAALREIYDGRWSRHLGSRGGQTLAWSGKAAFLGAVTETIDRHLAVIGAMGERFVLCRMPTLDEDGRLAQARAALNGIDAEGRAALADTVHTFLTPILERVRTPDESPVDREWLAHVADLATRCRSVVERDTRDRQVELVPQPEATARFTKVLAQLDRALHIIGLDETQISPTLTRVALDSLPGDRRAVLEQLVALPPGVALNAHDLGDRLGLPSGPIARVLEDLAAHRAVARESVPNGPSRWAPTDWLRKRWEELDVDYLDTLGRGTAEREPF